MGIRFLNMQLKFIYIFLVFLTCISIEVKGQTDSCKITSLYSILFRNEKGKTDSCAGFCDYPDIRCENPNYIISEFDVVFENRNERRRVHNNYGNSFSPEIRNLMMKAEKGSTISLICIKTKSTLNGSIYFLKPRTIAL